MNASQLQLSPPTSLADNKATQVCPVGDWRQREFATATSAIASAPDWPTFADLTALQESIAGSSSPPELVLLAQPSPGMYQQADIDELHRASPLTRIVVVAGSWCEGELRTGTLLAGVIRLYWYELSNWWHASERRSEVEICPLWSRPLDHPQSGRFSTANIESDALTLRQTVLINAHNYSAYETLTDALSEYGIHSSWSRSGIKAIEAHDIAAGIWDGGQLSEAELNELTHFCKSVDGNVVALLDFPRIEHFSRAKAAGATAVLPKPYIVEELVALLSD